MSRTKRYDHMCHPPKFESDTQSWQLRRAPGVMPDSPVAFMEKTFVVPPRPCGDTLHVQRFCGKTEDDVFSPRRMESDGPNFIPIGLDIEELVVENPGLQGNNDQGTRAPITRY